MTTPSFTTQTEAGLLVANVTGSPDPPPAALRATDGAPTNTGEAGAKPVIVWGNKGAALMTILAFAFGAAA